MISVCVFVLSGCRNKKQLCSMKTKKKKSQKETHIKNKFVGSLVYMEKRVQGNDGVFSCLINYRAVSDICIYVYV